MSEMEKDMIVCKKDECEFLKGNVIEFDVKKDDCEIRADVKVKSKKCVRIWGRVKDCYGKPVEEALVKLVKRVKKGDRWYFEGIAHTITDCEGFYQFDICDDDCKTSFRIIVSKAATGKERILDDDGECDPCDNGCRDK